MSAAHRHRAAQLVVVALVANVAAVLTVRIAWPDALLPLLVGWCLSWLTAVAWLNWQDALGWGRHAEPPSE